MAVHIGGKRRRLRGRVQLHPATIIISFLVMGTLVGVVGARLAVPATVVFTTLVDELCAEDFPARKDDEG
ncbi:MAG: hypothetical protein M3522_13265 [Actinomycetota bacterium]|nr:hypothetical protein [Actinomycetota bacterium]